MLRKWVLLLTFATGAVAGMTAIGLAADDDAKEPSKSAAGDQVKTPLQKVMVKMDDQLKAIQKVTSSAARFKKSAAVKEITAAADQLVKLGDDTRKFTEPAEAQKKPQQKWEDYTDSYVAASKDMAKAAKKKDYAEIRQAYKLLDSSCTNCHGLFRPKTGGDEFGGP